MEFSPLSVGATAEHVPGFDFLPWLCCLLATCGALQNTSCIRLKEITESVLSYIEIFCELKSTVVMQNYLANMSTAFCVALVFLC